MTYATSDPSQLALQIWNAGVAAVRSDQIVKNNCHVENELLRVASSQISLDTLRTLCVIGGGKAGAGMASGLENALPDSLLAKTTGWINVPEGCTKDLRRIHLHPARPAGINVPIEDGILGTKEILRLASSLGRNDVCICLLSGGGSALLPLPRKGVTLEDKRRITQLLSSAGANILQLNTVRRQLSDIKAGGLARACNADKLITLIISDVIGDPLDVIASGPTVIGTTNEQSAVDVIDQFIDDPETHRYYKRLITTTQPAYSKTVSCEVTNSIVANNRTSVHAAAEEAARMGCSLEIIPPEPPETTANELGLRLAEKIGEYHNKHLGNPICIICGGEPIVRLAEPNQRGKGGRNQQLVLSALNQLTRTENLSILQRCSILSGGTDGEDGPTDAAGAVIGPQTVERLDTETYDPASFLNRNDAYSFFERIGGLIKTGPTHTNVCDLRVAIVQPK